jgi:hypothetical protein
MAENPESNTGKKIGVHLYYEVIIVKKIIHKRGQIDFCKLSQNLRAPKVLSKYTKGI